MSNCLFWALWQAFRYGGSVRAVPSKLWIIGPHYVWLPSQGQFALEYVPKVKPDHPAWIAPPLFRGTVQIYEGPL